MAEGLSRRQAKRREEEEMAAMLGATEGAGEGDDALQGQEGDRLID